MRDAVGPSFEQHLRPLLQTWATWFCFVIYRDS
jgi:hypothetical protein